MGNESAAEQRANQAELKEREKWMEDLCNEHNARYKNEKNMLISTLIAPKSNSHDDSGIKDTCFEYHTKTYQGVTFDLYVGGSGRYKNQGDRGFTNWTCCGYDHRQDGNVMILGEENAHKYRKQIDDEKLPDEFISINFDLKNGAVSGTKPQSIWKMSRENNGNLPQSWVVSEEAKTTNTSRFVANTAMEMKTGVKFSCGVPEVSCGEVSQELTMSMGTETGEDKQFSKSFKIEVNNQVAPGTKLTVEAVVFKSTIDVPYTLKFKRAGKVCIEEGIWKGVTTWELNIKDTVQNIK
eukprot:251987_1